MTEESTEKCNDDVDNSSPYEEKALWPAGSIVAITISPNPRNQGAMCNIAKRKPCMMVSYDSEKDRFVEDWNEIFQAIEGWRDDWKMYLEIGKNGFFHWHGYATLKRPEVFNREFGFYIKYIMNNQTCIKHLKEPQDIEDWKTYCKKDHKIMGTILSKKGKAEGIMKYIKKK